MVAFPYFSIGCAKITVIGLTAILAGSGPCLAVADADCARLEGVTVASINIGLPSGAATIVSAVWQSTGGAVPADFCRLLGVIQPRDPKAPLITMQINLPAQWNGKAVQYGGSGFNGVLVTGLDPLLDAPVGLATPLQRGFATWGTNSGHQSAVLPELQAFALNDEALANFAYASYKKLRDVAVKLAVGFYRRPPDKIYYFGGSEGGREGLTMAQRFPADFDGIVSIVPVINFVGLILVGNRAGVLQQNGGWLNPAKVALLSKAVLAACDASDGLADGIVSRYQQCIDVFNPRVLRCEGGKDGGDICLSDAQLKTVEELHRPFAYPFPLANGITSYPGYNYGSETQADGMVDWLTGSSAPRSPPNVETQARMWYYGSGAVRYFLARDPKLDTLKFDPAKYRKNLLRISALMDSTNPDLSAFSRRGGKLIMKENACDFAKSMFQTGLLQKRR